MGRDEEGDGELSFDEADVCLGWAADYEVWALETKSRRAERMPVQVRNGRLHFTADVNDAGGARMLYYVVAR